MEVSSKNSLKRFRWETETVSQLIDCLLEYKTKMAYRNLDFDADKQIQYQELRVEMAKLHVDSEYMFGPLVAVKLPDDFETRSKEEKAKAKHDVKESKDMIRKGQKRVMEKVKEIRQSFSKAVVSGSRSGSRLSQSPSTRGLGTPARRFATLGSLRSPIEGDLVQV